MKYLIGVGGAGGVLSHLIFNKISKKINDLVLLNFSTSTEDTLNQNNGSNIEIIQVVKEGAGKNYLSGEQMWNQKDIQDKLRKFLEPITKDDDVFIIASTSGGSGSSGIKTFASILEKKARSIVITTLLPAEDSVNFKVNSFYCLNDLVALEKKATILIFDNKTLFEEFNDDINIVNNYIADRFISCFFMKDLDIKTKAVWTLDINDFREIIFKEGFLNYYAIKEFDFSMKKIQFPSYGSINNVKRVLIVYNIKPNIKEEKINAIAQEFQKQIQIFIKKFAKNIIVHYGIIHSEYLDDYYYIFGNGLSIQNLLYNIKNKVSNQIEKFKNIDNKNEVVIQKDNKKDYDLRKII